MMYRFNFSYEDLSKEGSTFLKGVTIYINSSNFIEAIKVFNNKYPNSIIKGIVINEN